MPNANSCLLHVFCFAEYPYQTESKRDKNGQRIIWNIYDFWEVKPTRDGARGGQETRGAPHGGRLTLDSPRPPVRWLTLFFCRKKANFMRKIWAKDSPQSELRISGYKRNGAMAESGNAETERDREIDPISKGLCPSHAMEAKDQRGNPSPV